MTRKRWRSVVLIVGLITAIALVGGCFPVETGSNGEETEAGTGDFWSSMWPMLIFIVLLIAMMYFVMIRPQRKRQREHQDFIEQLHRGDKVITAGGIHGEVESVSDDSVVLRVESGATMRVAKGSVITKQYSDEPTIG